MTTRDGSFSFSSLFKPGDGATSALTRDLRERQSRETGAWLYKGMADYVVRHGKSITGRALPPQYADAIGTPTHCHINSLAACKAYPELRYFTGYYLVSGQVGEHSWCVAPDDQVVEVTFPTDILPPEYWAYYGLEFKVPFVQSLIDAYGPYLPILGDDCPFHAQMMSHRYAPDGFTPTP